ncbi:hypothetical protein CHUAL_009737 [Chamberlinius hualienensis]
MLLTFYLWSSLMLSVGQLMVSGHGRMVDPPARNTMWRHGFSNPENYNDDELFCGGVTKQWVENSGKCGICGDPFNEPKPRKHEAGGFFGNGIIVQSYPSGGVMNVTIILSTNHKGWFEWRLCPYKDPKKEVPQSCLDDWLLPLADNYKTRYYIPDWAPHHNFTSSVLVKLPERLTCKHCLLQWTYYTGNFWGLCENGTGALGCGPQETYKNCADISIGYQHQRLPWHFYAFSPFKHNFNENDKRPNDPFLSRLTTPTFHHSSNHHNHHAHF